MSDEERSEGAARDERTAEGAEDPEDVENAESDRVADERGNLVRLSDLSDTLLSEVKRLRETEDRKRRTSISTPEFHALAAEVEDRARKVWQAAATEKDEGNEIDTVAGFTTNDAQGLERDGE